MTICLRPTIGAEVISQLKKSNVQLKHILIPNITTPEKNSYKEKLFPDVLDLNLYTDKDLSKIPITINLSRHLQLSQEIWKKSCN